jgi:hypothetical protein
MSTTIEASAVTTRTSANAPVETITSGAVTEIMCNEAFLKTGALQDAILNSANFSSIATDEKGSSRSSMPAPNECPATLLLMC